MSGEFESLDFNPILLATKGFLYPQDDADVACGVPPSGGWAFVAIQDGQEVFRVGESMERTTEVRCQLEAVLEALRWANREGHHHATVVADNDYVVKGVGRWIYDWERRGWRTANGNKVANIDQWQAIRGLLRHIQVIAIHSQADGSS